MGIRPDGQKSDRILSKLLDQNSNVQNSRQAMSTSRALLRCCAALSSDKRIEFQIKSTRIMHVEQAQEWLKKMELLGIPVSHTVGAALTNAILLHDVHTAWEFMNYLQAEKNWEAPLVLLVKFIHSYFSFDRKVTTNTSRQKPHGLTDEDVFNYSKAFGVWVIIKRFYWPIDRSVHNSICSIYRERISATMGTERHNLIRQLSKIEKHMKNAVAGVQ